jgi:hypothetical protein
VLGAENSSRQVARFDWRGCAAHLESEAPGMVAEIERFIGLEARTEDEVPANANDATVSVLGRDRGVLVRTSSWQAWAGGRDQLVFLVLEALGQVFVDGYAGAVFHAGAIDLGEGALIIQGLAQSGKSTLVHAAWKRGHNVLSDDRVTLAPELDRVGAFPKCLKLRCTGEQEAAAFAAEVPQEQVATARVGAEWRVVLARSLKGFVAFDEERPIRALIQLERGGEGVSLEPSEALGVALRNIVSPDFNPTAAVRLLKAQADQHRLYRLSIGERQVDAALDRLRAL